jgi:putative restriction endonuclease
MTWLDVTIEALRELGGEGSLEDIYKKIEELGYKKRSIDRCSTWQNTVRQIIYDHSSDSESFRSKEDVFRHIERSVWALRKN